MQVKSKIQQLFPISASRQHPNPPAPQPSSNVNPTPKTNETPQTYTFYHSTRYQSSSQSSNNQPQIKDYRQPPDITETFRKKSQSLLQPNTVENSNFKYPLKTQFQVYAPKNDSPFKKHVFPKAGLQFSKNSMSASRNKEIQLQNKEDFNGSLPRGEQPTMVQSTVFMKGDEQFQGKLDANTPSSNFSSEGQLFKSNFSGDLLTDSRKKLQNSSEITPKNAEVIKALQQQVKILQNRNFQLAQQMVSSESALKSYQRRLIQMQQANNKFQESIKISRNIITSLNEKVVRHQKEYQIVVKQLKQDHQQELTSLEVSRQVEVKNAEALVFQLKLKVIDQSHQLQLFVAKAGKEAEERKQLDIEKNESKQKIVSFEENNVKLNEYIVNLEADLMNLDRSNICLDQQNQRLVKVIQGLQESLDQKSKQLSQQCISSEGQISSQRTKTLQLQKQLSELKLNCEVLEESNEEKDSKIAELNINYTKIQLDLLQFKEKFRKKSQDHQDSSSKKIDTQNKIRQEISLLNITIAELQSKLKSQEEDKYKMSQQLSTLKTVYQNKMTELSQAQQQLQNYQESLAYFQQIYSIKEIQVTKLVEQLGTSQQDQPDLIQIQKDFETLRQQLEQSKAVNSQLRQYIEEKQLQFVEKQRELIQTIDGLNNKVVQLEEERVQIKDYVREIQDFCREQSDGTPIKLPDQMEEDLENNLAVNFASPIKSSRSDQYEQMKTSRESPTTMQEWLQMVSHHSRQALIMKIHQLYFMNNSLNMKVEEYSELEQNQNSIIMDRIKSFQESIEKYQQDITDLDEQNRGLRGQMEGMGRQCQFFDGKVSYLEFISKELEVSLFETNEELLKTQAQLFNLRMGQGAEESEMEKSSIHEIEDVDNVHIDDVLKEGVEGESAEDIVIEEREELREQEVIQLLQINQPEQKPLQLQEGEKTPRHLIEQYLTQQMQNPQQESAQTQQNQPSSDGQLQPRTMTQGAQPLTQQDLQELSLHQFMEDIYHYQVQEHTRGGVTFSIVVSQVHSDDQEPLIPQEYENMFDEYQSDEEEIPFKHIEEDHQGPFNTEILWQKDVEKEEPHAEFMENMFAVQTEPEQSSQAID